MKKNSLEFINLNEVKAALRTLPTRLVREASGIVESNSNAAAFDIRTAYGAHWHTGNLQSHVVVDVTTRGFGVRGIVRSTARHAYLFEIGTQGRHRYTKRLKRFSVTGIHRGAMPGAKIFVPRMIKWRRRMYQELKALLTREGFVVRGEADVKAA